MITLTNNELQQATNVRNTILEWDSTLQNNPSFDDVCDYIEAAFINCGVPFDLEEQKPFISYMCNYYLNK